MLITVPVFAQQERGELRLEVRDPSGGPVVAWVELISHLNVINFASSFSGTAVAVPRNGSVRVAMVF